MDSRGSLFEGYLIHKHPGYGINIERPGTVINKPMTSGGMDLVTCHSVQPAYLSSSLWNLNFFKACWLPTILLVRQCTNNKCKFEYN